MPFTQTVSTLAPGIVLPFKSPDSCCLPSETQDYFSNSWKVARFNLTSAKWIERESDRLKLKWRDDAKWKSRKQDQFNPTSMQWQQTNKITARCITARRKSKIWQVWWSKQQNLFAVGDQGKIWCGPGSKPCDGSQVPHEQHTECLPAAGRAEPDLWPLWWAIHVFLSVSNLM